MDTINAEAVVVFKSLGVKPAKVKKKTDHYSKNPYGGNKSRDQPTTIETLQTLLTVQLFESGPRRF